MGRGGSKTGHAGDSFTKRQASAAVPLLPASATCATLSTKTSPQGLSNSSCAARARGHWQRLYSPARRQDARVMEHALHLHEVTGSALLTPKINPI